MKVRIAAVLSLLVVSLGAFAQTNDPAAAEESLRAQHDAHHAGISAMTTCPSTLIHPPTTINGVLTTSSCRDFLDGREDVYAVTVTAGQTIDIDYSSHAYEIFLYMYLNNGTSADVTRVSYLSSGTSRARIHHTFATAGTYLIEADTLWSAGGSLPTTGAYTLSVAFAGGCVPDTKTACLLNGRFQARVRYRGAFDNAAADTDALVKPVTGFGSATSETVFFYFNSANNIEMLLKMLDQGNTTASGTPTIAVLYGSASPLRIELTITDTKNNAVKTYTTPFAAMTGGTDFTAFVK
ncbi:MAG: PPC domain-containing protein [Acidobacteria bacterium]|nr:PPC domain-containing protein [Acidobacteriota bacterium]MBV9474921.1 PPC domain-containing protein [Acidobacteriota bacterium]